MKKHNFHYYKTVIEPTDTIWKSVDTKNSECTVYNKVA